MTPNSGGVHIVQILNILEGFDVAGSGPGSATSIHIMAEAMKRAYTDRSRGLGDPNFVNVPVNGLISKAYANELREGINLQKSRPGKDLERGSPFKYESAETTHYSVVNRHGNAVANTTTINFSFGSGIVVAKSGFLLNNEMDDFSAKPGIANAYGLLGGNANAISPAKRMLSSMSRTIVLKDGEPFLVTGSPGGGLSHHHQHPPGHPQRHRSRHEFPRRQSWPHASTTSGFPMNCALRSTSARTLLEKLRQMGHNVTVTWTMGAVESILVDPKTGLSYGASDPRRAGLAVGY